MRTIELDIEEENTTTFQLKGNRGEKKNIPSLSKSLNDAFKKINSYKAVPARIFSGLQSTFYIYSGRVPVRLNADQKEVELDYDFTIPLQPKKKYTVKARIKSVKKHSPRIFFD